MTEERPAARLRPYVAGLALDWLQTAPHARHRRIEGSLAFVDISGFTTLTERLAARGKAGAEEMSDVLDRTFAALLEDSYGYGASLVKWGGDAVLLLFQGPDHPLLAARACFEMQRTMRRIGRLRTSVGPVQLRMSVGVHTDVFDFFLGGRRHHELLVTGSAATTTAVMEQTAEAGEVVVSEATAAQLPPRCVGDAKGAGWLLRAGPLVAPRSRAWVGTLEADVGSCLDPTIREHLLAEVGDCEHRQVAVGFVEVSGVDDLLTRQGPGATADALHEVLALVQEQCHRHRVTFWETDISRDGFKVMVVAGSPRSSGRDEEDLLRAARSVLDGHSGPLRVRIGVNCGRVFTGSFGPLFRRTWSAKGDAINLAARVMGKAQPGQLLATQQLLDRVAAEVRQVSLEPFLVKGKQHLVQAAAVESVTTGRAAGAFDADALFGRDQLLAELGVKWGAASAGQGSAVLLLGDPGAGKSALVGALVAQAGSARVLRCFSDAYQTATPHYVLGRLLVAALELPPHSMDAAVVVAVETLLARTSPSLLPQLPLLAAALGVACDETPESAAVPGEFRAARLATLVVDVLSEVMKGPALLVVEDAHDMDAASAEVLGAVALAAVSRSWLLLVVGRSAPDALRESEAVEEVTLALLSRADSRALVLARGGAGFPAHVLRALVDRAEGNPLFLIELTAAVNGDEAEELPSTLEELLVARIDDLAPRVRQVVRVASVLGTRFEDTVLEVLLGGGVEDTVWKELDRFVAVESLGWRRFRSGLVRDAAYEGLPFRRRADLHGSAADVLRQRATEDDADIAAVLSLHTLAAKRYDEAWLWSVDAGRRAQRVHANVEALACFARARLAARRLPGLDATEHAVVLEAIGDLHARLADLEPAVQAYGEARRRAPGHEALLRARIALSTALLAQRVGQLPRAARWLAKAQRECREGSPDRDELAARITVERAWAQHMVGREAHALRLGEEALVRAEQIGALDVMGRALLLVEWIALWTGKPGDEDRVLQALDLFEQCDDLPRQGGAWNHLGMSAYFRGEWDRAVEHYTQAQQVHERCADEWTAAIASANIAEIRLAQGRLAEAEPLVTEALRVWRASGTPSDIGFGAALLGRLCAWRGRTTEAMGLLTEAAACFAINSERVELVDVELRIAEALVLQGLAGAAEARLAVAAERLREAVRVGGLESDEQGVAQVPHAVALLRLQGVVAVQLQDGARASTLLARGVDLARRIGSRHELALSLQAQAWAESSTSMEGAELLAGLGVVWTPEPPRTAAHVVLPDALPATVSTSYPGGHQAAARP